MHDQTQSVEERIAAIIANGRLAAGIVRALGRALDSPVAELVTGASAWDIFQRSLESAIRDIATHTRGKLLQRLLLYGAVRYDEPERLTSDGKTTLSDPECGLCVEFIYSHMINRFKGELAELLAVEPVLDLVQTLVETARLPPSVRLYWGEIVQQRTSTPTGLSGHFAKGADGLLVEKRTEPAQPLTLFPVVHGIVEVKSSPLSVRRVLAQIDHHTERLRRGLKLRDRQWFPEEITLSPEGRSPGPIRVVVVPSSWRLSRQWKSVSVGPGRVQFFSPHTKGTTRALVSPPYTDPPVENQIARIDSSSWKITLAWSNECLAAAAHEMTYWYMARAGQHLSDHGTLPKYLTHMTAEEAGHNLVKQAFYFLIARPLKEREWQRGVRLYNVYSFGYPLGVDSKKILAPEDFAGRSAADA